MILSGFEIENQIAQKAIVIEPYDKSKINPNSYNLSLGDVLLVYEEVLLDPKLANRTRRIKIPDSGYVLEPGELYLAQTLERTETHCHVPMIEGRSSLGRLGLFVHVTAGFGDVGFCGYWTLEMMVHKPLRIYKNMQICQIYYHTIQGDYEPYKSGKYQNNEGVQPSLMWKEYK